MELYHGYAGVAIQVPDAEMAAVWMCDNLFFEEMEIRDDWSYRVLINGNCVVYMFSREHYTLKKEKPLAEKTIAEIYRTGLTHIALHAANIDEALKWCKGRGLNLILDGSGSSYNPGVFGKGERYFNILSPFGVIFEVSEQVADPVKKEEISIRGLDHLGIPCADIEQEMSFLEELGFRPLFDMVYNYKETEGHIACDMMSDGAITLEVYQLVDRIPSPVVADEALMGIAYKGAQTDSPGGVHFIGTKEPAMNKTYDIMAIGECLVDILCREQDGKLIMEGNPGGAPANVLAIAGKLGMYTGMISKVGQDQFGSFLREQLSEAGIGMEHVKGDETHPTTLAMVQLNKRGDRSFTFYRNETAEVMLTEEEIPYEDIRHARILHFGSVSLTTEPSRSATLTAVQVAKEAGVTVSYDPNLRPPLWSDLKMARVYILKGMEMADYVKVSDEELLFLTKADDVEVGMRKLFAQYPMKLLIVTLGAAGCVGMTEHGIYHAPAYLVDCVDTTGAGDAYWGALLSWLLLRNLKAEVCSDEEMGEMLAFACAAGSLTTTKTGAIPAMPDEHMIWNCMRHEKTQ